MLDKLNDRDCEIGSDNVFADLGFEPQEAVNLKIRVDLMLELRKFIQSQGWTQAQAAIFFGETQPRIIDILPRLHCVKAVGF
jgi:predicted XRE-type DNA-binding protein